MGLHIHHILFRSQGGPDEDWNLIALCKYCHDRAHGLSKETTFPRWLLHLIVATGIPFTASSLVNAKDKDARVPQVCLSCDRYGDAGYCAVWEEDYAWDYWCSAWKLRQ